MRGNNLIKQIQEDLDSCIIFNITRTDSEVVFQFKSSDMSLLEKYLKPKTNGSHISPFSSKNLPRNKEYIIPEKDLVQYNTIVDKIGNNRIIELTHITRNYLKSMVTHKNTWKDMKADMAVKGLSGKKYIHAVGKWEDYIKYLKKEIKI